MAGRRSRSTLNVPNNQPSQDATSASTFEGFLVLQLADLQDRVVSRVREYDGELQRLRGMAARALEGGDQITIADENYDAGPGSLQMPQRSNSAYSSARQTLPDYKAVLPTDLCIRTSDSWGRSASQPLASANFAPPFSLDPTAKFPGRSMSSLQRELPNEAELTSRSGSKKSEQACMVAPPLQPKPKEVPAPPLSPPPLKVGVSDTNGRNREEDLQSMEASSEAPIAPALSVGDDFSPSRSLLDVPNAAVEKRTTVSQGSIRMKLGSHVSDGAWKSEEDTAQQTRSSRYSNASCESIESLASLNQRSPKAQVCISDQFEDNQAEESLFTVLPLWKRKALTPGMTRGLTQYGQQNDTSTINGDHHLTDEKVFAGDYELSAPRLRRTRGKNTNTTEMKDQRQSFVRKYIIVEPHSPVRFSWDIFGLLLITFDAATIPLQFFDPPRVLGIIIIEWIARMFWTFDMPLSCTTGFISQDGAIEMELNKIVYRYATSWCPLDVLVVSFDWLDVMIGSSSGSGMGAARAVKAFKFIRMLRLMRLMRLMKMPAMIHSVMSELAQHFRSEKLFFIGKIGKVLFLIIGFVHVVGCFWYAIGEAENKGWVREYRIFGTSLAYRYMTSFHWSLANFSGAMDVEPQWVGERAYAVVVLLSAWMISATALSFITTAMTRDSFSTIQQSMQTVRLRRYLQEHGVNRKLQERLLKNAKYAINQKSKNMNEEDVELLQLVSVPLLIELHFEVNSPVLRKHPFFDNYADVFPAAIRRICHTAVSQHSFSVGDVLFTEGEKPSNPMMYFTLQGELKYMQVDSRPKWIHPGGWVCEPVIWTEWVHAGYLCSVSECTLLGLSTARLYSIVRNFDCDKIEEYASIFVSELNSAGRVGLSDMGNAAVNPQEIADYVFHGIEIHEEHWAKPAGSRDSGLLSGPQRFSGEAQAGKTPSVGSQGRSSGRSAGIRDFMLNRVSSLRSGTADARSPSMRSNGSNRLTSWIKSLR